MSHKETGTCEFCQKVFLADDLKQWFDWSLCGDCYQVQTEGDAPPARKANKRP